MPAIRFFLSCVAILCSMSPAWADERQLRLTVHPYLAASELMVRFTPLTEYLQERLGRGVSLDVSSDYQEQIEDVGEDRIDIAYMGPISYLKMVDAFGEKTILARLETNGTATFRGAIVVSRNSAVTALSDLKGKRFAFGDPNSTMSYVLPFHMLRQAGISDDLGGFAFVNNHHNVALGVLMGRFDAGAVKGEVFDEYRPIGLRSIMETPSMPEHVFVAGSNLRQRTVTALQKILLALPESSRGLDILKAINPRVTGLTTAAPDDYRELRFILQQVELPGVDVQ